MGRRSIELVKVLVDQIHQGGYQHRVLEDSIYQESQKRIATEKDRDHWKQARQDAHEAGELMRAEIETLRQQLADAQRAVSDAFAEVNSVRQQLDAAEAAETRQPTRIERLHKFVGKARLAMWPEDLKSALTELDAATEPLDAEGGA